MLATVLAAVGVEVGPGGGAAVGVVAKLVHVEAVLAGAKAGELASHGHGAAALLSNVQKKGDN